MDDEAFKDLMASLDSPMAVITVRGGEDRGGCLVGFHCQSSIDPGRYAVWLSKANHTYRLALLTPFLGVHLLTEDDFDVAEHFGTLSGDDVDKLAGWDVVEGAEGVPLLAACPNRMVVRRTALVDEGGDHVCIMAEPIEAWSSGRFRPLRLSAVDDLTPGHEAEERPRPADERADT